MRMDLAMELIEEKAGLMGADTDRNVCAARPGEVAIRGMDELVAFAQGPSRG